jgi:methylated-DNA-[protein]-cysteine S-methyltransferase
MKPKRGRAGAFCLNPAETSWPPGADRERRRRRGGASPNEKERSAMAEFENQARHARPVRLRADTLATPLGEVLIVCDAEALCIVDYDGFDERVRTSLLRRFGPYELIRTPNPLGTTEQLARYFAGDLRAVDELPVNPGGTPYQRRVWDALRTIPPGQTRSYGQLATQLGATHARAVGQANALNPIAIVVPCHRVIGADAALTGYAGGLARKRWLLDHEAPVALALPF